MSVKLCIFFLLFSFITASAEAATLAKPGCQEKCGNLTIAYPFGIGSKCSMDRWTELRCDAVSTSPKLLFTHSFPKEVVEFSSSYGYKGGIYVRIKNNISTICSDKSGAITSRFDSFLGLQNAPFTLGFENQFTVIGCDMSGVIGMQSKDFSNFTSSCSTLCDKTDITQLTTGCQMNVPQLRPSEYNIRLEAINVSGVAGSRCGYAFLADNQYEYTASAIESLEVEGSIVKLYFVFANQSCNEIPSLCKQNSYCNNYGGGYYCSCADGYEGNPYIDSGCQDINECDNPEINHCKGKCINTPGSFRCAGKSYLLWILLGVGLGLLLLGGGLWMHFVKRKQVLKLSEKLVRLNARLLLIQEISSQAKLFTAKKLEQATNNFHESRILGQGGYGTVYKGILPDQTIVAVKKSKLFEKAQFDEFINEVAILTKIDHRHIVKLLGCSVETEHPLLVYEFVSNGSLSDHLYKKSDRPYSSMSWETRLRIAAETSGALAYLHSAASIPIIHRDVKSSNILLDDNFTAKVADFGVSRVNHLDQTEINTLVKGTPGYLDPEYMQTSQLTEKSDVFSFGVVLAELLTGKKPISFERPQEARNLAICFAMAMNEERLLHIVEEGMVNEGNIKEVHAVAAIAQRCLNFKGEERPSMKKVASELEALTGFSEKQPSARKSNESSFSNTSEKANHYPTSIHTDGASMSSVAEETMSVIIAR